MTGAEPWRWPADGRRTLAITWPATSQTGWGRTAAHLAIEWGRRADLRPVLCGGIGPLSLDPLQTVAIQPAVAAGAGLRAAIVAAPDRDRPVDGIALQIAGNRLGPTTRVRGARNVHLPIVENTAGGAAKRAFLQTGDALVAASRWNAAVLEAIGGRPLPVVHQGIDPAHFHPAPRLGLHPRRFVIFSGGKVEHRKGQDIVIAAFRAFRTRRPEALLLVAWASDQRDAGADIAGSPHVAGPPPRGLDGGADIAAWLAAEGIAPADAIVLPAMPNRAMAPVMREADVALFPNRGEGGTNLVLMEAMALGLPCIAAANTGHLDVIAPERAFPLLRQTACRPPRPGFGVEGWGESDVAEIVEALEQVHADRAAAAARGAAAARFIADWTWARCAERLAAVARAERTSC
ncbi:MAG: glycosyltransferase family 4 protein [Alphaproteobacteria bacterium]